VTHDEHIRQDVSAQWVRANVYRTNDRIMVAAAMPGLQPEDICVTVGPGSLLTIHGDLRGALKDAKEVVRDEWTPGPYHRESELPDPVDGPRANVTYHNGVLVLVLPTSSRTAGAVLRLSGASAQEGERVGHRGQP
jgi:HSP20 family protein